MSSYMLRRSMIIVVLFLVLFVYPVLPCWSFNNGLKERTQEEKKSFEEVVDSDLYKSYYHFALSRIYLYEHDLEKSIKEIETAVKYNPSSSYLRYQLALLLVASNRVEDAIENLKKAIELEPYFIPPYKLLGRVYATSSDSTLRGKAESVIKRALDLAPNDYELHLILGAYYVEKGDYRNAKRHFREAIRIKPSEIRSYLFLAEILRGEGKLKDAAEIYKEILLLEPDNFIPLLVLSIIYEKLGELRVAKSYYDQLVERFPTSAIVQEEYGSFLYRINETKEAQIRLENAEVLNSSDTGIKLKLGIVYLRNKRYRDALRRFNFILSKDPANESALYYKALCLKEMGEKEEALSLLKSISSGSEYYVNAVSQIVLIYEEEGSLRKAISFLREVLESNGDIEIVGYLGELYRKYGMYSDAIDLYRKFLKTHPNDKRLLYLLGVTYFYSGKEEKAIDLMRIILKLDPNHADAMNFIGYTYVERGINLDEAERLIRKALELSPNSGYILDSLGWLYYKRGEFQKAVEIIERASDLSPEDATIKEHLGDSYLKVGDMNKALKSYRDALKLLDSYNYKSKEDKELQRRLERKIKEIKKLL